MSPLFLEDKSMKSLERRFLEIQLKREGCAPLIIFDAAVKGRKFSPRIIALWFNKLVPKDDYDKREKRNILRQLVARSWLEDGKKQGKTLRPSHANTIAATPSLSDELAEYVATLVSSV